MRQAMLACAGAIVMGGVTLIARHVAPPELPIYRAPADPPAPWAERLALMEREKSEAQARDAASPEEPAEWTEYREAEFEAVRAKARGE